MIPQFHHKVFLWCILIECCHSVVEVLKDGIDSLLPVENATPACDIQSKQREDRKFCPAATYVTGHLECSTATWLNQEAPFGGKVLYGGDKNFRRSHHYRFCGDTDDCGVVDRNGIWQTIIGLMFVSGISIYFLLKEQLHGDKGAGRAVETKQIYSNQRTSFKMAKLARLKHSLACGVDKPSPSKDRMVSANDCSVPDTDRLIQTEDKPVPAQDGSSVVKIPDDINQTSTPKATYLPTLKDEGNNTTRPLLRSQPYRAVGGLVSFETTKRLLFSSGNLHGIHIVILRIVSLLCIIMPSSIAANTKVGDSSDLASLRLSGASTVVPIVPTRKSCSLFERRCDDGSCKNILDRCPGDCTSLQRKCSDGKCIYYRDRCLDEPCLEDKPIMCKEGSHCYNDKMRCDNRAFCLEGEDEEGCFLGMDVSSPKKYWWKLLLIALGIVSLLALLYGHCKKKQRTNTGERTTLSEERGRLTATPQTQNPVPPTSTTSVITQLAVQESDAPPDYEDVLNNDTAGTTLKPSNDELPSYETAITMNALPRE